LTTKVLQSSGSFPAVVLAGGLGTRLGRLGLGLPKILAPVAGRPFLDWKLANLMAAGASKVYLLVGHLGNQVEDYIQRNKTELPVSVIRDHSPQIGTAGALLGALPSISEDRFVLTYGDNLLELPFDEFTYPLTLGRCRMVATSYIANNDSPNLSVNKGLVTKYSKELDHSLTHIDYGYMFVEKQALVEDLSPENSELSESLREMVSHQKIEAYTTDAQYLEIGNPKALQQVDSYLRSSSLTWLNSSQT